MKNVEPTSFTSKGKESAKPACQLAGIKTHGLLNLYYGLISKRQTHDRYRDYHYSYSLPLQRIVSCKKVLTITIYIILHGSLFSQQVKVTRDIGVWGGVRVEKEFSKNLEINVEQQVRFYTNATKFDDYIIDFGWKYKMNKNLTLGANLRYTYNEIKWKEAENNYRYNLDLRYKGKISTNLKLYYRLRFQKEFVNLFSEYQSTNIYYSGLRSKVRMQYEANKKNEFYISGELFRLMKPYREPYFNKIRFFVGDKLKTKVGNFNCSLGYEQEINTDYPLSFYFVKTIYILKL